MSKLRAANERLTELLEDIKRSPDWGDSLALQSGFYKLAGRSKNQKVDVTAFITAQQTAEAQAQQAKAEAQEAQREARIAQKSLGALVSQTKTYIPKAAASPSGLVIANPLDTSKVDIPQNTFIGEPGDPSKVVEDTFTDSRIMGPFVAKVMQKEINRIRTDLQPASQEQTIRDLRRNFLTSLPDLNINAIKLKTPELEDIVKESAKNATFHVAKKTPTDSLYFWARSASGTTSDYSARAVDPADPAKTVKTPASKAAKLKFAELAEKLGFQVPDEFKPRDWKLAGKLATAQADLAQVKALTAAEIDSLLPQDMTDALAKLGTHISEQEALLNKLAADEQAMQAEIAAAKATTKSNYPRTAAELQQYNAKLAAAQATLKQNIQAQEAVKLSLDQKIAEAKKKEAEEAARKAQEEKDRLAAEQAARDAEAQAEADRLDAEREKAQKALEEELKKNAVAIPFKDIDFNDFLAILRDDPDVATYGAKFANEDIKKAGYEVAKLYGEALDKGGFTTQEEQIKFSAAYEKLAALLEKAFYNPADKADKHHDPDFLELDTKAARASFSTHTPNNKIEFKMPDKSKVMDSARNPDAAKDILLKIQQEVPLRQRYYPS